MFEQAVPLTITQHTLVEDRPIMQMIGTLDLEHIEHLRYAWWMLSDGCITNFMAMLAFRLEAKNRTVYKCIAYTPARYDDCTALVVRRECMERWISIRSADQVGTTLGSAWSCGRS